MTTLDPSPRYLYLKAQMRTGVWLSREDFLFVKAYDQTMNSRKFGNFRGRGPKDTVLGGFSTK